LSTGCAALYNGRKTAVSLLNSSPQKCVAVKPRLHGTTGCQTRFTTGLTTGCIV